MFSMVPYSKRKEDVFNQFARSLSNAFQEDFYAPFRTSATQIRTDIREADNSYLIEAELPGFSKEDITIEYNKPFLTIKAVRKEENEDANEQRQVIRRERRYGEYIRRFQVENVDDQAIRAALKDGVLKLELPKLEKPQVSRIEIQDGNQIEG